MLGDCRQSPLKTLPNTFGMGHKTHTMTTRYGSHDMEDVPASQDAAPLDHVPPDHTMPKGNNESSDKYCEETDTFHPFAKLLEQFQQLKDQFTCLISATDLYTAMAELMQLMDKLQHLSMKLQLHPAPHPNEEPIHKTMQAYMDTLYATQREKPHHNHAAGYPHI